MDSATYCEQAIAALRDQQDGSFSDPGSYQEIVALSSFGQQALSARDFTRALNLLLESSERSQQPKLADAARLGPGSAARRLPPAAVCKIANRR